MRIKCHLALAKSLSVAFIGLGCFLISSCAGRSRHPVCFVFPAGFSGWAVVEYNVQGADVLSMHDGCVWADFRRSALLETKDKVEEGWAEDRYFEEVNGELRTVIYGVSSTRAVQEHIYTFVGTGGDAKSTKEYLFFGTAEQKRLLVRPESSR